MEIGAIRLRLGYDAVLGTWRAQNPLYVEHRETLPNHCRHRPPYESATVGNVHLDKLSRIDENIKDSEDETFARATLSNDGGRHRVDDARSGNVPHHGHRQQVRARAQLPSKSTWTSCKAFATIARAQATKPSRERPLALRGTGGTTSTTDSTKHAEPLSSSASIRAQRPSKSTLEQVVKDCRECQGLQRRRNHRLFPRTLCRLRPGGPRPEIDAFPGSPCFPPPHRSAFIDVSRTTAPCCLS
jgi:hypothetical protein